MNKRLSMLLVASLTTLILILCSCGHSGSKTTSTITKTTVSQQTQNPTTTPSPTTNPPTTEAITPSPKPTLTAFPYQGSGIGTWTGQLTIDNQIYQVSGTMSVTVDENGVFTGSITSSSGGSVTTDIAAKVDSHGNLNGTVTFTINSSVFVTTWQGKMTASGNTLSMQGTWTSQYGSGTFSGTGTSTM
jgi:hypothetical protein